MLPAASDEIMVDFTGQANRNRVQFTSCRQFTGQSVLSFADPAPVEPTAKVPEQELRLPPGVTVNLRLTEDIDLEKIAIGDPVSALLDADVKLKGRTLLPKGAVVSGRLSRMERHSDFTVLGFVFSDAEAGNTHARLELIFDRLSNAIPPRVRNVRFNAPVRGNEAIVILPSGSKRLSQGILMVWRT